MLLLKLLGYLLSIMLEERGFLFSVIMMMVLIVLMMEEY